MPLLTIDDLLLGDPKEIDTLAGMASGISEVYERFLDEDGGDSHTRAPGIHASEATGCKRRLIYSLMGEKRIERSSVTWKKRFKIGHAIHNMFQADFHKMAKRNDLRVTFEDEVKLKPCMEQPLSAKWDIQSSADGIFTIWEDDKPLIRCLLEIKTASPTEYEKLTAPKDEHIRQATIYQACLDVPLVWFLYFNKGNQNFTPSDNPKFFRRYDPDVWAKLEKEFEEAHTNAVLKKLPDREESMLCEICAFSHTCNPQYLNKTRSHAKSPGHWRR